MNAKKPLVSLIVTALSLVSYSPLGAAQPKEKSRVEALVSALRAVSPDPLGGRLGLEVAAVNFAGLEISDQQRVKVAQVIYRTADQQAYLEWKRSLKS